MRNVVVVSVLLVILGAEQGVTNPYPWPPWGLIVPSPSPNPWDSRVFHDLPGLVSLHAIITYSPSGTARGCKFSMPTPPCLDGGIWLSDSYVFAMTTGDAQTGVEVDFGSCLETPVHVFTTNYFIQGANSTCCFFWVRPSPLAESGRVEVVDCENGVVVGDGGAALLEPLDVDCSYTVGIEKTTWGRVKALYETGPHN